MYIKMMIEFIRRIVALIGSTDDTDTDDEFFFFRLNIFDMLVYLFLSACNCNYDTCNSLTLEMCHFVISLLLYLLQHFGMSICNLIGGNLIVWSRASLLGFRQ